MFLRQDGKHSRETLEAGLVYTEQETASHTMWKVRIDKQGWVLSSEPHVCTMTGMYKHGNEYKEK